MKLLARHDTLIAIIGTGILTAAYYLAVARPGRQAAEKIESEIAQTHVQMGQFPQMLAERSMLQARVEQQREQQSRLEIVLPTDSRVSDVLHNVASLARTSGLTINRLEPLPSVEFHSYSAHPFHLSCRGEFKDLARFLNGLETHSRLVTFGSVDFSQNNEGSTAESPQPIQANINFKVYSRHAKSTKLAENTSNYPLRTSDN